MFPSRIALCSIPIGLLSGGCIDLQEAVLHQTSVWEAKYIPAEIGAGVAMALGQLQEYQQRAATIAEHYPNLEQTGCVVSDMEDRGGGVLYFTFNYYGCDGTEGYVYATVVVTSAGQSITLDYEDYVEQGVTVTGSVTLVDSGDSGLLILDYETHYAGMEAALVAEGEWFATTEGAEVTASGDLRSAAGLDWVFEALDLSFASGCEGVESGRLNAQWGDSTEVEADFSAGACDACYPVSVDGDEPESFCPSSILG